MNYVKYVFSSKGLEAAEPLLNYTADTLAKMYALSTFIIYFNALTKLSCA